MCDICVLHANRTHMSHTYIMHASCQLWVPKERTRASYCWICSYSCVAAFPSCPFRSSEFFLLHKCTYNIYKRMYIYVDMNVYVCRCVWYTLCLQILVRCVQCCEIAGVRPNARASAHTQLCHTCTPRLIRPRPMRNSSENRIWHKKLAHL